MISTLTLAFSLASAATGTEITVYNEGFGLVKETRTLKLKQGLQNVAVEDVAEQIEANSVSIKSLGAADAFSVLEQNYQYDLISPVAILSKSVGQRVKFIRTIGNQRDVLEGVLLSSPYAVVSGPDGSNQQTYNGMVIRTDDGRIVLSPSGEVEVLKIPDGLISKPTLIWQLESPREGEAPISLSYITQGMSWSSDYVLTLDGKGKADLQGWVTMNNQSGATFENAKLKLLAGDVQRAPETRNRGAVRELAMMAKAADAGFKEESLFEYHLYTLQRPTTLKNKEIKQISLLEGLGVPVQKKLIVDGTLNFGQYYPSEGEVGTGDIKPQVRIEFTNDEASHLGMPLPKGKFKVYQRDESGSVQLLGEDNIDHTPRNEKLSIVVGRSFDVVANRKRTNFERLSERSVRQTFEIEVRNRKATPETIHILERHWGDWRVTAKSQEFIKLDSNTMQFVVTPKANQVLKVTYSVETKW
ncbi:MAG: DUF4139 domain-containing protein [Fimbriimonas sp.]